MTTSWLCQSHYLTEVNRMASGTYRLIFSRELLPNPSNASQYFLLYTAVVDSYIISLTQSYQKLPFGSGDYPYKLLYHQALNYQVSFLFRFKTV